MAGEPVAHSRLLKTRLAHHGNRRDEARRLAWLFVTPFAVLCFLFIVAPVLATVGLSFFRKHPFFLEFQFNGWNNYAYVFRTAFFGRRCARRSYGPFRPSLCRQCWGLGSRCCSTSPSAESTYSAIVGWNDYLFARIFISSTSRETLTVGVMHFFEGVHVDWGLITAASVIMTVPMAIVFMFVQRYLVAGFGAGGIKG